MEIEIRHIFFDVGDTLRITRDIPEHRRAAKERVKALLGAEEEAEAFAARLNTRYDGYREWATSSWVEMNERELWTKWLAPEYPVELVERHAVELTFLFRQFKGLRFVADHAMEVVQALTERGYRLGIISNVITSRELPDWLEEDGFAPYFHPVVLSSLTGIRKPDPELFRIALREADISPQYCAYVGDNVERDMGGANAAGFRMKLLIDHRQTLDTGAFTTDTRPDAIIRSCLDLLDIFPAYPTVNQNARQMYRMEETP